MPSVTIYSDIGGSDYIPHTFMGVTDSAGKETFYGFGPAIPKTFFGPGNVDEEVTGSE